MTLLLTHPQSISLITLPKPFPTSITPSTLSLPSRFPSSSSSSTSPQVTTSSTGNIYLWSTCTGIVWEYDSKGRRISEISFPGEKVNKVLALNKNHVMVNLKGKDVLQVMEKVESKWKCLNTLQAPKGELSALISNAASSLVATGSNQGELAVFDQITGERTVVQLEDKAEGSISPLLTFCLSLPSTLLLPTPSVLLRLTLPATPSSSSVDMRELPIKGPILDITFSPVTETADGIKKGGLCAVLKANGEVALIGLENDSTPKPKIIQFNDDLMGLNFLDGATLAGRTKQGGLLVKDLRSLSKPPIPISCPESITSIRILPSMPRSTRPSLTHSSTSSRRTPLSDKNVGNIPTPPPVPILKQDIKGKAPIRETELKSPTIKRRKSQVDLTGTQEQNKEKPKERVVSAPVTTNQAENDRARQPRQSNLSSRSRSASGPSIAVAENHIINRIRHDVTMRSNTPIIEEEEEEQPLPSEQIGETSTDRGTHHHQQQEEYLSSSSKQLQAQDQIVGQNEYYEEPSMNLDWVLKPPSESTARSRVKENSKAEEMDNRQLIEELYRRMSEMQMDMLRMKRTFRNELRRTTESLKQESLENQELIERQRREINRLRRGY
ncbi:uncharacterized protein L201_006845 [Kwoniella dendrophila CBS 6074]|uniref:Uncharacterized protein n=1 Tax=Kwoniella dendrophila CBS 6074 TaxID=1295534 RepID=A0AAX4K2T9_9TREE